MSTLRIATSDEPAPPLPELGHGLWVDRLIDVAEAESLARALGGAHLDMLVDLRNADSLGRLREALAMSERSRVDAWLLVIVSDAVSELQVQLQDLRRELHQTAIRPKGMIVTPAAYLHSYQPAGPWPAGPSPENVAVLAREILPEHCIGGGVPVYFTELNRCPPAFDSFDYLTHATSPIVHAADDLSVMESLQSLGYIVSSGRRLAHGKPYRLTTTAIGAWCNPYGGQLTPNPDRRRLTLSDQDPRQRGLFAAAWTVGHYAAVHRAGVDAIALWAVNEPFVAAEPGAHWPVFHVLRGLNRGRGRNALALHCSSAAVAAVGWEEGETVKVWLANLTACDQSVDLADLQVAGVAELDADTMDQALKDPAFMERNKAPAQPLTLLKPYGVVALDCRRIVERRS